MNPVPCSAGEFSQLGGVADRIPGTDFIVAAGHLNCLYENTVVGTVEDAKAGIAGAFMHELGHTLGLHHGGGQVESATFKTNYVSVMNYFYAMPWLKPTAQGTTARDLWTLDYSHRALKPLSEDALLEEAGLDGPMTCRQSNPPTNRRCRVLFNSRPADQPEVLLTMAYALNPTMDWNNDGTISEDPLMPGVDLNRIAAISRCDGAAIPINLETHTSHSDWDVLTIEPPPPDASPAAGNPDGPAPGRINEMDQFQYFSILEADWFDQTAPVGLPFSDGFE
jgi:hypothetical protein